MSENQNESLYLPLENFSQEPDQMFLYSCRETNGLNEKQYNVQNENLDFDNINMIADFDPQVQQKLKKDYIQSLENKLHQAGKEIMQTKQDFFNRNSIQFNLNLQEQSRNTIQQQTNFDSQDMINKSLLEPKFEGVIGCNPKKWPDGLQEFQEKIETLEGLAFFNEPIELKTEFFENSEKYIQDIIQSQEEGFFENLILACKAYTSVSIKSGLFEQLIKNIDLINKIGKTIKNQDEFYEQMHQYIQQLLQKIQSDNDQKNLHYAKSINNMGGFLAFKVAFFAKQSFQNNSITTDGTFLYIYISANNGGMYKIGTGENDTIGGKIYLYNQINKHEEIQWVFCKNHLYMRNSSSPLGTLDIICPNTFKQEGLLQLYCPDIFGAPNLQIFNKNYPILTDGDYIYLIGKKIYNQILEQDQEKKVLVQKLQPPKKNRQNENKKKEEKEKENDGVIKLCDFILYKFDVSMTNNNSEELQNYQDNENVKELFQSFSGFFTLEECARALNFNKDDIQIAASWLADEGEKERLKQTVVIKDQTLLAQAEIISDISQKYLKNNLDIQARENSILFPNNVSQNIWTMDKNQITVYTEMGIKIFSKNPNDVNPLKLESPKFNKNKKKSPHEERFLKNNEDAKLLEEFLRYQLLIESSKSHQMLIQEDYDKLHYKIQMLVKMTSEQIEKKELENLDVEQNQTQKIVLKGTHIKTIKQNNVEKYQYQNPQVHMTYDHVNKKFYSFIWSNQQSNCQLPSLISVGYDYLNYEKEDFVQVKMYEVETFQEKCFKILLELQKKRYQLPFRLNNFFWQYGMSLANFLNQKDSFRAEDENYNKTFQNNRQKLLKRLKKCQTLYPEQKYLEIKNIYALTIDGSLNHLNIVLDHLINNFQNQIQFKIWIQFLQIQLKHQDQIIYYEIQQDQKLQNKLDILREFIIQNIDQDQIFIEILIKGFQIFAYSKEIQKQYILYTIQNQQILKRFYECHLQEQQNMHLDYPYKESRIQNNQEFKKIDNNLDFQELFLQQDYIQIHSFIQKLGQLFIDEDDQIWEKLKIILQQSFDQNNSSYKWKLFNKFFILAIQELERIDDASLEQSLNLKKRLVVKCLDIINQVITKEFIEKFQNNSDNNLQQILAQINGLIINLSYISSNLQQNDIDLNIYLIQLFEKLKGLIELQGQKQDIIHQLFLLMPNEGVDSQNHKILETNHPYERSKVQSFDAKYFPNAIALSLEFDRRCQSDVSHDFFTIQSYYDQHNMNSGIEMQLSHGIGNTFKISGKPNIKKQIILLGNTVEGDFSSSAHSRDEHSLSRWGYKVTVRPIYGINIEDNQNLKEIQENFGSSSNFQLFYFATRTLLSSILDNIEVNLKSCQLQSDEKQNASFLNWAIFKKGLSYIKPQNYICKKNKNFELLKEISQSDSDIYSEKSQWSIKDRWELIKKQKKEVKLQEKLNKEGVDDQEQIQSCQYDDSKIEQILNENENEFFSKIQQLIKKLVPVAQTYIIEKKRPTFSQDYQKKWEQTQDLIILVSMHHFGLLNTNVKDYVEDQFKNIGELRNMILQYMIAQVQNQKEWQFALTDIINSYNSFSSDYTQDEIHNQIFNEFQNTYQGNSEKIFAICQLRQIQYDQNEPQIALHNLYDDAKQELQKLQKNDKNQLIANFQSPYEKVANKLINKCKFLLRVNPFFAIEKKKQDILNPLGISRSMSVNKEEKIQNPQNLDNLRQIVDLFQSWKRNSNYSDLYSKNSSPLKAIYAFLTQNVNYKEIENCMVRQSERCSKRLIGLQQISTLMNELNGSIFEKNITNFIQGLFKKDIYENINCVPRNFKILFCDPIRIILKLQMEAFNQRFVKMMKKLATKKPIVQNFYSLEQQIKEHLKLFFIQINEISILLNSYFQNIWSNKDFLTQNNKLAYSFFYNAISLALYVHSFSYISNESSEFQQMSMNIISSVQLMIMKSIDKINFISNNQPLQQLLDIITQLLSLELGINKDVVQIRVLGRMRDMICQSRIIFLIKILIELVETIDKLDQLQLKTLINRLFFLAYFGESPNVYRILMRFLKMLKIDYNQIDNIQNYKYVYNQVKNLDEVIKQKLIKPIFIEKQLQIKVNKVGTVELLLEKLGLNIIENLEQKNQQNDNLFNQVYQKIDELTVPLNDIVKKTNKNQVILVHLLNEEDINYLFKVFYYWEEQYPTFTAKYPKTLEEYLQIKDKQKEQDKKQSQQQQQQNQKTFERIFNNFPEYNFLGEENLPVGWQLCQLELWPDMNLSKNEQKNIKIKKTVKKVWANHNITKIFKKFEELEKTFESFKEEDSEQDKLENIKARYFIKRILHHIKEIQQIASVLNVFGYGCCFQSTNNQKIQELAQLLYLGIQNKLKPISVDHLKEEYRKKLEVQSFCEQKKDFKSQMIISICDSKFFQNFNQTVDHVTNLSPNKESFQNDCNKAYLIHKYSKIGYHKQQIIQELIEFFRTIQTNICKQQIKNCQNYSELLFFDKCICTGALQVISGWVQNHRPGGVGYHKDDKELSAILQTGYMIGKQQNQIINLQDGSLNHQIVDQNNFHNVYVNQYDFNKLDFTQLLTSLMSMIDQFDQDNSNSLQINIYALLNIVNQTRGTGDLQNVIAKLQQFQSKIKQKNKYQNEKQSQNQFLQSWFNLQDFYDQKQLFQIYKSKNQDTHQFEIQSQNQTNKQVNLVKKPDQSIQFTLSQSSYIQDLQESKIVVTENKLLKYWEKFVIPRIQDFVRSSYSQWEFDDFFEQMRTPLRKGDQTKATEIAYIMCDKRLPTGVTLPEMNHDWNTLTLEEIKIGQRVILKIDKNKLIHPYLINYRKLNLQEVLVQVIAADNKSNFVLVLFEDTETNQLYSIWSNVNNLKPLQILNRSKDQDIDQLKSEFQIEMNHLLNFATCKTLLNFYLIEKGSEIQLTDMLKWSILQIFNEDPLGGFFQELKNDQLQLYEEYLMQQIQNQEFKKNIINQLESKFDEIINDINNSQIQIDLSKIIKEQDQPMCLSDLICPQFSSIIIEFDQEAVLTHCGGLYFYSDQGQINTIKTVYAESQNKQNLSPLVFYTNQLYVSYHYNAEALPPYAQNPNGSKLNCIVYGVQNQWTVCSWIVETLTNIKDIQFVKNILNILIKNYQKFNNGSFFIKEIYINLMNRVLKKLKCLGEKNIQIDLQFIDQLTNQVIQLLEKQQKELLCSSFISQLIEFTANLLEQTQPNIKNKELQSFLNLIQIISFFRNEGHLNQDITNQCKAQLKLDSQWDRIIGLKNLPPTWDIDQAKQLILPIFHKHKARIYDLEKDIFLFENNMLIFLDGWRVLNPDEALQENDESDEESVQEQEIVQESNFWICSACTFENQNDVVQCEICQTNKPQEAPQQQVQENIKQKNYEDLENKARQKENMNFDLIKNEINDLCENFWKNYHLQNIGPSKEEIEKEQQKQKLKKELKEKKKQQKNINKQHKQGKQQKVKVVEEEKPVVVQEQQKLLEYQKFEFMVGKQQFNEMFECYLELSLQQKLYDNQEFNKEFLDALQKIYRILDVDKFNNEYQLNIQKGETFEDFIQQFKLQLGIEIFQFLQYNGCDFKFQQSYLPFGKQIEKFDLQMAKQLMNYIWLEVCQETKEIINFQSEKLRFCLDQKKDNYENDQLHFQKYEKMYKCPLYEVRFTWALLKIFNLKLSECLSLINMKKDQNKISNLTLSCQLSNLRELWMTPIKLEFAQKVLQKTAFAREHTPKITLERLKIMKDRNVSKEGVNLKNKDDFIFTSSYEQLKDINTNMLRPIQPQGADPMICFEVIFKGENVQGEAGPYRQFFSDISLELQPGSSGGKNLNLLMPTPNNYASLGEGRDQYLLNSDAVNPYQLRLFEYLGFLMGCCIRTGTNLTLDLAPIVWKQIQQQPIKLQDFFDVDKMLCDLIQFLETCDKETFDQCNIETYSTTLSNKKLVELKQDGHKIKVQYEDRFDFIKRLLQVRIDECKIQTDAVRKGLLTQIPKAFLNTFSSKDLETLICGKSDVNIELLKRHTVYSGNLNENSQLIVNFWKVLQNLKPNEKLKFVKFCWGQERLPAYDEEFEMQQIRFMIKLANYSTNQIDKAFPRSDTCFFNLELPNYSSYEIMREQILKVIYTDCDSMNADQQINLDPNAHHNDDQSDYYEDINYDEMDQPYEEEEEFDEEEEE